MIDIANNHLVVNGKATPIKKWEVWYMTPFGLTTVLQEAVERCIQNDMDPNFNIIPSPIAVIEGGYYEIFFARR